MYICLAVGTRTPAKSTPSTRATATLQREIDKDGEVM